MIVPVIRETAVLAGIAMCAVAALGMVSCSGSSVPENTAPANSNQALLDVLSGHTEAITLGSDNGPQLILTPELSARVLGASLGGADDENLMWVDETLMDGSYWTIEPRFWNAGGLRTWLAPEDLFFVNAKKDPDSWFVPDELDPRMFRTVGKTDVSASFEADIDLPANIGKTYSVTLGRSITLLTSPPADAGTLPAGVEYMGIDKTHFLTNRSDMVIGEDLPFVCLWSLIQVNPAGTMLVPLKDGVDPEWAYREYFNPLGERLKIQDNVISIKIDGRYRCKIGVRPEAAGEGLAFLRDDGDGGGVLFIKEFPVDPEGVYVDKPWGTDSDYGDAIELYNDDGNMGGFTEIECHGPALRLGKGETQSHTLKLHVFRGGLDDLKMIASKVLGKDMSGAYYY